MKVTAALVTLGLALGAVSEPLQAKRDLAAFEKIFDDIDSGVDNLSTAVKGGDGKKIVDAGDDLVSSMKEDIESIKGEEKLELDEAFGLVEPVRDLSEKVREVVNDLAEKRKEFVSSGDAEKIKESLSNQFDTANSLADAVSSKVPDGLMEIARSLAGGFSEDLQRGINEYKDPNGSGGGGDGPGGDSSSTSSGAQPTSTSTDSPNASPSGSEPTPSESAGNSPAPAPTNEGAAPTSPPPPNAAVANGQNIVGVLAAAAAVLAF
ncbi:hypothetical protein AJ79_04684 [Helicocarpus griseus UAMH5409]|uniref:Cell wall protein n=1 Tax=Helicocarpus griseus UAMH5409 TaxID=1447875 RepID=A0A2B7XSP1_9EURO|nr:hypothetical protein AJ79_04684 [Helicocarpus griseus UAMH5409]